MPECPGQHYVAEGDHVCHPCDPSCETCSGPTLLQCLSCPQGHPKHMTKDKSGKLAHYICSPECLPGYYRSKEGRGKAPIWSDCHPHNPHNTCCCYCCCVCLDSASQPASTSACCCYYRYTCSTSVTNKLTAESFALLPMKQPVTARPLSSAPAMLSPSMVNSNSALQTHPYSSPALDFQNPVHAPNSPYIQYSPLGRGEKPSLSPPGYPPPPLSADPSEYATDAVYDPEQNYLHSPFYPAESSDHLQPYNDGYDKLPPFN